MTVIILLLFFVCCFYTKSMYSAFLEIRERIEDARVTFDRFTSNYKKVRGRVMATGYNVEYDFPGLDATDVLGESASEDKVNRFNQKKIENRISQQEYGEVLFRYGYAFNDQRIISRVISIYGNEHDLEFFYKFKAGDALLVYVDPNDPLVSSLKLPTEKEHSEVVWNIVMGNAPKLLIGVIIWAIFAGVIYSQF